MARRKRQKKKSKASASAGSAAAPGAASASTQPSAGGVDPLPLAQAVLLEKRELTEIFKVLDTAQRIEVHARLQKRSVSQADQELLVRRLLSHVAELTKAQRAYADPFPPYKDFDAFGAWLKERAPECLVGDAFEFAASSDGKGTGVVAARALQEGETFVRIPRSVCLTVDTALHSESVGELISTDQLCQGMPHLGLAVFLAMERLNPASEWRPYLDVLPTPADLADMPLFYSLDKIRMLHGTQLYQPVLVRHLSTIRQYAHFYRMLNTQAAALGCRFTYDVFRWAVCVMTSRQNAIPRATATSASARGFSQTLALIPGWDMCNHVFVGEINTVFDAATDSSVAQTLAPVAKGEPIYINYGPRPNRELLLHMGFVVDDNPHNEAYLHIRNAVAPDDPTLRIKESLIHRQLIDFPSPRFAVPGDMQAALNRLDAELEHATAAAQQGQQVGLSKRSVELCRLLFFLRVCVLDREEIDELFQDRSKIEALQTRPFSPANENRAWKLLQQQAERQLASFSPTLEADRALLAKLAANPDANSTELTILRYRVQEKELFATVAQFAFRKTLAAQQAVLKSSSQPDALDELDDVFAGIDDDDKNAAAKHKGPAPGARDSPAKRAGGKNKKGKGNKKGKATPKKKGKGGARKVASPPAKLTRVGSFATMKLDHVRHRYFSLKCHVMLNKRARHHVHNADNAVFRADAPVVDGSQTRGSGPESVPSSFSRAFLALRASHLLANKKSGAEAKQGGKQKKQKKSKGKKQQQQKKEDKPVSTAEDKNVRRYAMLRSAKVDPSAVTAAVGSAAVDEQQAVFCGDNEQPQCSGAGPETIPKHVLVRYCALHGVSLKKPASQGQGGKKKKAKKSKAKKGKKNTQQQEEKPASEPVHPHVARYCALRQAKVTGSAQATQFDHNTSVFSADHEVSRASGSGSKSVHRSHSRRYLQMKNIGKQPVAKEQESKKGKQQKQQKQKQQKQKPAGQGVHPYVARYFALRQAKVTGSAQATQFDHNTSVFNPDHDVSRASGSGSKSVHRSHSRRYLQMKNLGNN